MSWWTKARDQVVGTVSKAAQDVGGFAWKGVKDVTAFQLNLYTLGAANKYTSVSKWGGTGLAGKAGTVTGFTLAAVGGGYAAAGAFAPAATSVGAGAAVESTVPVAVGGEMFAEEAAAGSMVAWAEPAAMSSVSIGSGGIATGAGTVASWLQPTGTIAGLLAKIFGPATGKALSDKASQFVNEVFGGSGGAPGSSPGGSFSGGDTGSGGIFGTSKLPYIIIGLVLLGAILLTRKKRSA